MKIGILTFHRAINYGAVLQAYALQETLRHFGHEVCIIDYRQPRVERTDRRPYNKYDKINLLKGLHLRSWWHYDSSKKNTIQRRNRFDKFINKYLNLSDSCIKTNIPYFDIYIIGSDQVWNSKICDGLDPVFWGNFPHPQTSKIMSYAASTSTKDLQKHDSKELQDLLLNFNKISVRENNVCSYLNDSFKLNDSVQLVLDPTLLADKKIWDSFDDDKYKKVDYVLYFGARTCEQYPSVLKDKAESLAKQCSCNALRIDFNLDSPIDFVNKFRYAKAVVTSSFHGVAFSLIFNKPLYAITYGDEQDARYVNVLKSIGAENMLADLYQDIIYKEKDYQNINEELDKLKIKSLNYLETL